ncbi:MAG TPA: chromate transporter [Treponemataceae bacterium]|nr:chromate transporter [Treponemataceae bacterium]
MQSSFRELVELFFVFFRIGAFTFGGGLAMLPILERDLVKRRGWLTGEQLIDYFAIGQSTPGIIAVNVATFVGYNKKKTVGAIVATAGVVVPSLIIITILASFLNNFADILWVQKALRGINVVVAVLLITAILKLGKKTLVNFLAIVIAIAAFVGMTFFNVSGIIIVSVSALLGLIFTYRPGQRPGKNLGQKSDQESANSSSSGDDLPPRSES